MFETGNLGFRPSREADLFVCSFELEGPTCKLQSPKRQSLHEMYIIVL